MIRRLARPAVHLIREVPVHLGRCGQWGRGQGPTAIFLPSSGPEGAARLRVYEIAKALRSLGWQTLVLNKNLTLAQRRRFIRIVRPDLIFMQGVRHALNRPMLYPGERIVFDMDDADFHLSHLSDHVRSAMHGVAAVIAGSEYVAEWCRMSGARDAHVVWTGARVSQRPPVPQAYRLPVIAWGQTRPMTYLREAEFVRAVIARVAQHRPGLCLRLFDHQRGDVDDFARSFAAPGLRVEWIDNRPYSGFLTALDDVAVGFAPLSLETPFSRGKSFGKVLAYLDAGVPVIASDACEHGAFFAPGTGVVSNDPEVWISSAVRLLDNPAERQAMADAAHEAFRLRLSLDVAARRVDQILRNLLSNQHNSHYQNA